MLKIPFFELPGGLVYHGLAQPGFFDLDRCTTAGKSFGDLSRLVADFISVLA
jgi:hypothetical protein